MSYTLFQSEKYADSKANLDEIRNLQGNLDLDCLLLAAECDLFTGCDDTYVTTLHDALVESTLSNYDINRWADNLKLHGRPCAAILLHKALNDRYETNDPNDAVCYIDATINIISEISSDFAEINFKTRAIVSDYVIYFIMDMLERLRAVENPDKDYAVLLEARGLNSVAYCGIPAREYQRSISCVKQGIELMIKHFTREGCDPSSYCIYGNLQNNLGVALERLGRHAEAEVWFTKALESYKMVEDFEDDAAKTRMLKMTKSNTRIVHKKHRSRSIW